MSRVQIEITLGILITLVTSVIILIYGINEPERMESEAASQRARSIEVGAELFDTYCSRCHGTQGLGITGLCPPLNDRNFFDNRLEEVGWSGTLEDYIVSTVISGRLASTRPQLFPGQGVPAMPSFGEASGGPLREDQIRNIAAFISNWSETAELVEVSPPPEGPLVGTDITKELPQGDLANGEALTVSLGCTACHIAAETGPAWLPQPGEAGIGERAATRLTQSDYTGNATSPEQYLFESIVLPNDFLVEGFAANIMPNNYGTTLTDQDMADLIAYMLSIK